MPDALGGIGLRIGVFRFTIAPLDPLAVPAVNKANMLRGGFGHSFRRLCCVPQCRDTKNCPVANSCPYKAVFEPSPPPGTDRLSKNQDIPRPFVFRAPQTHQTRLEKGERFEFGLVLIGRALDFLPYFVLSFRELAREGLGLNRAKCTLERVEELGPSMADFEIQNLKLPNEVADDVTGEEGEAGQRGKGEKGEQPIPRNLSPVPYLMSSVTSLVYSAEDQLFRATGSLSAADWINTRLRQLTTLAQPEFIGRGGRTGRLRKPNPEPWLMSIQFLTPTFLRADGEVVRRPEFHHVFKRLRDRINALSTFYGDGPLDVDFRGLGERAERVPTVSSKIEWVDRFRTSSKTHQRHQLSGFVGECTYEFPSLESGISNVELLQWLALGELVHVGKHTAWGNGWYQVTGIR
jgi:hypothetical protein